MKKNYIIDVLSRLSFLLVVFVSIIVIIDKVSIYFLNHRNTVVERAFSIQDIRKPTPYVMFKGAPGAKAWYKYSVAKGLEDNILNDIGYPGEVPTVPKPEGEYRIAVLGGSTAFMGNPPIPRLIQYQFEKKGCHKVKVYNFAVVSSIVTMDLMRLIMEVVDYDPDLIISYAGFNDIDQPFVADPRPGYPLNYFVYESNPILDSDIRTYPLVPLMAYGSNLMRNFYPSYFLKSFADLDAVRREAGYGTETWRNEIVDAYLQGIIKSHKVSHAFGVDFMVFFQPSLYFKDIMTDKEKSMIDHERKESSLYMRKKILDKAEMLKNEENILFYDLSDMFNTYSDTVYVDRVHLDRHFRPDVAKQIYKYVLKHLQDREKDILLDSVCFDN